MMANRDPLCTVAMLYCVTTTTILLLTSFGQHDDGRIAQQDALERSLMAQHLTKLDASVKSLTQQLEGVRYNAQQSQKSLHARISSSETVFAGQLSTVAHQLGEAATLLSVTASAKGQIGPKPQPYTDASASKLHESAITIHGVELKFAVRDRSHLGLLREHVSREINGYALVKDAIANALAKDPKVSPLVMDVGSNHGLYSLFAAKLGADVITLEPQESLCRVINRAAKMNGPEVAAKITLYHNAALDHYETVTMR